MVTRDLGHHFPLYREGDTGLRESVYWKYLVENAIVDDGGTAGTEDENAVLYAAHKLEVVGVYAVFVDGDHNGANTDYASISVTNRGDDGDGTDEIAVEDFTSGVDADQYAPVELTLDDDYVEVERGEVLSVELSKSGSGNGTDRVDVFVVYKAIE